MSEDDFNPSADERERLLRILNVGVKALQAEHGASKPPCPESSTMVDYVMGHLNVEEAQAVNRHIVFCDTCFDDFLALLGPDKVKRLLDGERVTGISSEPVPEDASWHRRLERALQAVLDLGKSYSPGTLIGPIRIVGPTPALAARGVAPDMRALAVIEVPVGNNLYGIALSLQESGLLLDVAGYKITEALSAKITICSASGELLGVADTDIYGNSHLVLPREQISHGRVMVILSLEKHAWEAFFVDPIKIAQS